MFNFVFDEVTFRFGKAQKINLTLDILISFKKIMNPCIVYHLQKKNKIWDFLQKYIPDKKLTQDHKCILYIGSPSDS